MSHPPKKEPPAPRRPRSLVDRASEFLQMDPAGACLVVDCNQSFDAIAEALAEFADELLREVERRITDQHAHPDKLSRLYWQARMDAGREIHELRRGRGGA